MAARGAPADSDPRTKGDRSQPASRPPFEDGVPLFRLARVVCRPSCPARWLPIATTSDRNHLVSEMRVGWTVEAFRGPAVFGPQQPSAVWSRAAAQRRPCRPPFVWGPTWCGAAARPTTRNLRVPGRRVTIPPGEPVHAGPVTAGKPAATWLFSRRTWRLQSFCPQSFAPRGGAAADQRFAHALHHSLTRG